MHGSRPNDGSTAWRAAQFIKGFRTEGVSSCSHSHCVSQAQYDFFCATIGDTTCMALIFYTHCVWNSRNVCCAQSVTAQWDTGWWYESSWCSIRWCRHMFGTMLRIPQSLTCPISQVSSKRLHRRACAVDKRIREAGLSHEVSANCFVLDHPFGLRIFSNLPVQWN